jgi:hypothetical protein
MASPGYARLSMKFIAPALYMVNCQHPKTTLPTVLALDVSLTIMGKHFGFKSDPHTPTKYPFFLPVIDCVLAHLIDDLLSIGQVVLSSLLFVLLLVSVITNLIRLSLTHSARVV